MDSAAAERFKREWTGKRVTVDPSSPTLRRFAGRVGTVVTVNMNGRLLIQFDGLADIGWYDIAAEDVRLAATPLPPEEQAVPLGQPPVSSATHPKPGTTESVAPESRPNEAKPRPKSVLELARQQGAAKPGG